MRISHSVEEWLRCRSAINGESIGFVPTMGALHTGHASLIERCRKESDIAVVSIFINPLQFNDPKDLERYPQTLDQDLSLLERLGVEEVFIPPAVEIYPPGCRYYVDELSTAAHMEGLHRPGFFRGVMTVVLKLLNLVRADRAYFGEKDYQQLRVISGMASDFFIPTEIVACSTVRQASGLAESSRNSLLSCDARRKAACIHRALTTASTSAAAQAMLEDDGFKVEYVEEHWGRRFAAVFLEGVRLIDNVPLPPGLES
jgi:pantoate--beta-alanine ligase